MGDKFTQKARGALQEAVKLSESMGHTYIGSEHLLLGLLSCEESIAYKVLRDRGIEAAKIKEAIRLSVGIGIPTSLKGADMTPMLKRIIEESASLAASHGAALIGTEHLLFAILSRSESYACKLICASHSSVGDIKGDLSLIMGKDFTKGSDKGGRIKGNGIPGCPNLSKYATDLCKAAREGRIDPVIGRDKETDRVIMILSRRTKNNPCLIGEPGVGKTAVVEGLAARIVAGTVPESLSDKLLICLDIPSMVAGAKYRGEFEERMKSVMDEVMGDSRIILFVDELHTIIGAGGAEGAVDAANIIKPVLARGSFQMIGATTLREYSRYIEKDAALERRFQCVYIEEPSPDEAKQIILGLREKYERHHSLKISDEAVEAAVKLSRRYIGDRYLPDKAIDLIDEAASGLSIMRAMPTDELQALSEKARELREKKERAVMNEDFEGAARIRDSERTLEEKIDGAKRNREKEVPIVKREDIEKTVSAWTGIPVSELEGDEREKLLCLEELLKERIIGQESACGVVARAIRRSRTGLGEAGRPVGSFMFLGPTGVGKTALAKALGRVLFGDESAVIRLDMSEYMERHSVSRLIGAPPGYLGYGEGGSLTEKVRRRPFCVVLFDEIEKAHPDVFNILLQILDEGALTDGQAKKADFTNSIIIMTSNIGAKSIVEPRRTGFTRAEDSNEEMLSRVKDELKSTFSPELLNRIDETVIFERLTESDVQKITSLLLDSLKERAAALDIALSFDSEVIAFLAREGSDPAFGARPLKRAVTKYVEDALSEKLLSSDIKRGDKIKAKLKNGIIVFENEES